MSILQEYESIRRKIGEKEYKNICQFLEENPESFLSDVYYNLNDGDRRYTKWKIKRVLKNKIEKKKEWKEFKKREKERKEMDRRIKKRRKKKKTNDIF